MTFIIEPPILCNIPVTDKPLRKQDGKININIYSFLPTEIPIFPLLPSRKDPDPCSFVQDLLSSGLALPY